MYGLSTIIPKVINYLLAPYLTYIALSEWDFGIMSYFYAAIPFAFAILLLGMESAFFRFVGKGESEENKFLVFNTVWSSTIIFSAVFLCAVILLQDKIVNLIGGNFAPSIVSIVALIIVVDVISAMPFARLREEQRPLRFSIIKSLSVVVNVAFVVFFYSVLPLVKDSVFFGWMWVSDFGSGYVFVANLIASIVAFIMAFRLMKNVRFNINLPILRKILLFSIPLFIGGLAGTANEFLDRFFIEDFMPKEIAFAQLGIYSATLKITALMVIFTQMYRYAAEPMFLAKLKKEDFRDGNAEAMTFFVIVSIILFLGVTIYIDVFKYIIAPEYRSAMSLVPMMLISSGLMGVFLNLNFWYKYVEKTHFAIIITTLGLSVSVALNVWLIPEIGLRGAAYAKLASCLFMVGLSYYFNQKYYPIPYKIWRIAEYLVVAAIIFYIAKYMNISNVWLNYVTRTLLLLSFVIYAIKREKILLLLRKK